MTDVASFDAIMQCNLLEIFCEALGAALFVTDKRDQLNFASIRLQHLFPISDRAIEPGKRTRDLYSALYDAGCRLGISDTQKASISRDEWIAERIAIAWRERFDMIEQCGPGRWLRTISRRFPSGLGLTILLDISEHKKKENLWRLEQERVRLTEQVLDALPVAVAVKDRNRNFAAINQRFCEMFHVSPDALVGQSAASAFEHNLAIALDSSDAALGDGIERISTLPMDLSIPGSKKIVHRTRRIGTRANPYIAMTFEEVPLEGIDGSSRSLAEPQAHHRPLEPAAEAVIPQLPPLPRRVIYVVPAGTQIDRMQGEKQNGRDSCVVHTLAELQGFLPAAKAAGIAIDQVLIAAGADETFGEIAELHGIPWQLANRPGPGALAERQNSKNEPVATPASPAMREQAETALASRMKILVVEDNPINRLAADQIFASLGLDYMIARNGQEALTLASEIPPALVFADATLPDTTLASLAEQIAGGRGDNAPRPIIIALLTKSGFDAKAAADILSIADTMQKPLCPESVDLMIRKHMLGSASARISPRSAA